MLLALPLLAIPLVAYNLVAFTQGAVWDVAVFEIVMVRGAVFTFTAGGLLLLASIIILFIEILKSTRTGTGSIVDHLMSIIVFIVALIEFLLVDAAATETFFLLTIMALIDVVAGFSITIRAARRDVAIDPNTL